MHIKKTHPTNKTKSEKEVEACQELPQTTSLSATNHPRSTHTDGHNSGSCTTCPPVPHQTDLLLDQGEGHAGIGIHPLLPPPPQPLSHIKLTYLLIKVKAMLVSVLPLVPLHNNLLLDQGEGHAGIGILPLPPPPLPTPVSHQIDLLVDQGEDQPVSVFPPVPHQSDLLVDKDEGHAGTGTPLSHIKANYLSIKMKAMPVLVHPCPTSKRITCR